MRSDALGRRFLDKAIALCGENKKPFFGFIKRKTQVLAAAATVVVVTSFARGKRSERSDPVF